MEEPTQEQLINYISAAMDFYERVKGRGRSPTHTRKYMRYLLHVAFM